MTERLDPSEPQASSEDDDDDEVPDLALDALIDGLGKCRDCFAELVGADLKSWGNGADCPHCGASSPHSGTYPATTESESTEEPDEHELEEPDVLPPDRTHYDRLDEQQNVAPLDLDDDTLVLDVNASEDDDASQPDTPDLGEHMFHQLETIHVLGDLHGWAPGLINYLIEHDLATIEINGLSLGIGGSIDARAMMNTFARDSTMNASELPPAGLAGRPRFEEVVNGLGHSNVRARWVGGKKTGFIQLGDVIDRSDHSELACEILRQLIIDAPSNVFVLIGNHEQFVLEDEYDNWYLNEKRNAVIDARMGLKEWNRNHLRFMATIDLDELERSRLVFESYKESVQLLFLTQAAAQQKALSVDHGLSVESISSLLAKGWSPYNHVGKIAGQHSTKGKSFPGALASIVIGETLFHHAEPNQKISNLVSEMAWEKQFGWVNYVHGGYNLQASPHSHLLWSRGASDGATLNRPASQAMLEQISIHWPGLYNIVHGHTPTVSIDEFNDITKNESRPVSYLAESIQATPKYGRASKIRIYNIDEGMAPVYYKGSEHPDDPCRTPVGLRILGSSSREEPVLAYSSADPLLKPERNRSVRTDTRKLWVWGKGVYRNNNASEWREVEQHRHQICVEFDGMMFVVEVSPVGKELLSRNISGYSILKNLLVYLMSDAGLLPGHIKRQPPKGALAHVKIDKGEPHLSHMLTPKMAWKTAQKLLVVALGTIPGKKKNTTRVFGMNFLRKAQPFFMLDLGKGTTKHDLLPDTIGRFELQHGISMFCLSLRENDKLLGQKLNQWLGKDTIESKLEHKIPLCLGLNPSAPFSKKEDATILFRKSTQIWERPGKSIDIRDKPKPISVPKISRRPPPKISGGSDIRGGKRQEGAPQSHQKASQKPPLSDHEKKTPSQSESKPKSGKSSGGLEHPRPIQTSQVPSSPTRVPSDQKPKPTQTADIHPARTEGASGEITLVFTAVQCGRIISLSKSGIAPTLSTNFSVEYSAKWRMVTFALSEGSRETFKFPVPKTVFVESEVPWGTGGVGSPNCKKKAHGLNAKFFKLLVEYAHSMIADELRGD
ncbi:metallophosphoesterase [Candidatus Poseidonia alphae]|nr:metallophosphoesterase [Candidatus Poseidonia alphae]